MQPHWEQFYENFSLKRLSKIRPRQEGCVCLSCQNSGKSRGALDLLLCLETVPTSGASPLKVFMVTLVTK